MSTVNVNQARHDGAPNSVDAIRSIAHLADSCAFNHKHSIRHVEEARNALEGYHGGNPDAMKSVAWNSQHARKHIEETIEHALKLGAHISKHDEMLKKVPLDLLKEFIGHGNDLASEGKKAAKVLDHAFSLMDPSQKEMSAMRLLHRLMTHAHGYLEKSSTVLDSLTHAILKHELTKEEYARLSAHSRMPDSQLPRATSEWLRDTLSLIG